MSEKKKAEAIEVPKPEPVLSAGEKAEIMAALTAVTAMEGGKYRAYLDDGSGEFVTIGADSHPIDVRPLRGKRLALVLIDKG